MKLELRFGVRKISFVMAMEVMLKAVKGSGKCYMLPLKV